MSEERNTELVAELREAAKPIPKGTCGVLPPRSLYARAAAALESTSRALSEKEGECLRKDLQMETLRNQRDAIRGKATEATRQRDEALAALKASEEREAKLIRKLASARLRPEPSSVEDGDVRKALMAADEVLTSEDACNLDPIVGSDNPHEHAAGLVREALRVREATRPHPTDPGHWRWRGE